MRLRRSITAAVLLLASVVGAHAQKAWLFAYFREPGTQGIYLAISHDGYHFKPLNNDQPWIKPSQPGEIMRDVYLTRGPDHTFHMVWTWGWHGQSLGYAESPDLAHWSTQREILIMHGFPATRNVWAPETYWDEAKGEWLLIWSSMMGDSGPGNRIYSSSTKDFVHFTTPSLFFDPGYVVIDATIFHDAKQYYFIFKDQTVDPLRFQIRYATGPTYEGPWSEPSAPITESWSEGPSVVHVGDQFIVYYDHYRVPQRYEAVASSDWIHWRGFNDEVSLPAHCKHGSFLEITDEEAAQLEAESPESVDSAH